MSYSKAIYNAITGFLDDDDWKYSFDEERELIRAGVSLKNKLQSTRLLIDLRDDKYLVFATINLNCDEDARAEMAALLTRINYTLIFGCFEMDFSDGEVRFRFSVDCDGAIPSRAVVQDSIVMPALMMEKYGNAILKVMMGFSDAESAFEEVE